MLAPIYPPCQAQSKQKTVGSHIVCDKQQCFKKEKEYTDCRAERRLAVKTFFFFLPGRTRLFTSDWSVTK